MCVCAKLSENHTKRSNNMDFAFENIMVFVMSIDKLVLTNLVGEVMEKIVEFHILDFVGNMWIICG